MGLIVGIISIGLIVVTLYFFLKDATYQACIKCKTLITSNQGGCDVCGGKKFERRKLIK